MYKKVYLGHIACLPPSTGTVAPVINDAASLAKNAMVSATSSALPALYSNNLLFKISFGQHNNIR